MAHDAARHHVQMKNNSRTETRCETEIGWFQHKQTVAKQAKFRRERKTKQRQPKTPQAEPSGATTLDGGEEGDANSPEAVEDRHPPARERRAAGDHHEDEERRCRRRRPPGPRQGRARLCHVPPLEHRTPSQTACVRARREKGREVREARRMEAAEEGGRWRRRGGRALSAAPIYTTSAAAPASSPRPAVPALPLQISGFATRSPGPRAEGPGRKYEEPYGGFTRFLCLPKSAVAPTNCGG